MPSLSPPPPLAARRSFDREFTEQVELFGDLVLKADPSGGRDTDGDGIPDGLGDLQAVMWDCDDLMIVLFDYYASLASDGRISSLTFNEWYGSRPAHESTERPATPTVSEA